MKQSLFPATRATLLERLKDADDQVSWGTFVQVYRPFIYRAAQRAGLTHEEAEEVVQETLITVSRRINRFEYDRARGSFRGWLFRQTSWKISNQWHKRQPGLVPLESFLLSETPRAAAILPLSDEIADDDDDERDLRQRMTVAAMETLRTRMKPKHFQVLHALVQLEWPVAQVARSFIMSRGQVYLLKFRGLKRLKKQIALLEKGCGC